MALLALGPTEEHLTLCSDYDVTVTQPTPRLTVATFTQSTGQKYQETSN